MEKTKQAAPSANRLEGLDLARYVAFVGMVIVTIHAHDGDGPTIHTD